MRFLVLAALAALPIAPAIAQSAQPQLVEAWAPGGKSPVRHYRVAGAQADCRVGVHHVAAGKIPHVSDAARALTCRDRAPVLATRGGEAVVAD